MGGSWCEVPANDVNLRFKSTGPAPGRGGDVPLRRRAPWQHASVVKVLYVDPRPLEPLGDVDLADPELRAKVERAVVELLTD